MSALLFIEGVALLGLPIKDSNDYGQLAGGLMAALLKLASAGFRFVLLLDPAASDRNQHDALSDASLSTWLQPLLVSQGIGFCAQLAVWQARGDAPEKFEINALAILQCLRDQQADTKSCAWIGSSEAGADIATQFGFRNFQLSENYFWADIAHGLLDSPRLASVERITKETRIRVAIDLDRLADPVIATGIGFFDHMLEQLGKHSGISLQVCCSGDLHIDEHHTVEDCGLAIGNALRQALGNKRGLARYGFTLPMDESLASAVLDFSGRPCFIFEGKFPREQVGDLPTELVSHFFRSFSEAAGLNLHLTVRGDNAHHMVEACFKSVARAIAQAIRRDGNELPSTKGIL